VGARHGAKLLRPDNAGEAHEIPHRVFVGAAGAGVTEIGEPLDLGRHVGELVKLGGGQKHAHLSSRPVQPRRSYGFLLVS